jgi:anti-sigma regulatory factor (Ser/Thr protein kinase)
MQEGWSTATDEVREMGFGAGMGLPNMKRYADKLDIQTAPGKGTRVMITVMYSGT